MKIRKTPPLGLIGKFTFEYGIGERPLRGALNSGSEPDGRAVTHELTPDVTEAQLLQMVKKDYRTIYQSDLACEWIQINEQTRTITLAQTPGATRPRRR